jgi:glutathione S-transferase
MASSQKQLLLLTISYSHFAEKARWALAYYGVPHRERVLMPGFHISVVKDYLQYMSPEDVCARAPGQSETETPILIIYASDGVTVENVIQGSQKILEYLSSQYATPEKPDLYESCGIDQAKAVSDLEGRFDNTFGIAVRDWMYYDMLIANKWRSIIPFALLGLKNPVGWAQSVFWMLVSPLLRMMIVQYINLTPERGKKALEQCRASFREASRREYTV